MDHLWIKHTWITGEVVVFRQVFITEKAEARGNCFKGSSCKFAHGISALRAKPDSPVSFRFGFDTKFAWIFRTNDVILRDTQNPKMMKRMFT